MTRRFLGGGLDVVLLERAIDDGSVDGVVHNDVWHALVFDPPTATAIGIIRDYSVVPQRDTRRRLRQ